MEAVLLMGVQGAGKSTFYRERYFGTHVRISLDLLKTRHRESLFLQACLATDQRFVVDNTNPTQADRARYIAEAQKARYAIVGYYFQSQIAQCLQRNAERPLVDRVPEVAILATAKRFELPNYVEGFDRLHYVRWEHGTYLIEEWRDEVL